jgi:hypothetical protein
MNNESYLKMFEEFNSDKERFIMYTPTEDGRYEMTTTAISTEEMFDEDAMMAADYPVRIWYQFDVDRHHPAGATLTNKRIVKGEPNDPEIYNNPDFEFDTPHSDVKGPNIEDAPSISSVDIHSPSTLDRDDSYLKTFRSSAGDLR